MEKSIVVGTKVWDSSLYGFKYGYITQITEENNLNHYHIIYEDGSSTQINHNQLNNGYSFKIYEAIATDHELKLLATMSELFNAKEEAEAKKTRILEKQRILTSDEYTHLEVLTDSHGTGAVNKNIRSDLKKHFKDIKFKVSKDRNRTYVEWTDGATEEEVYNVIGKFNAYYTDELTGDYRDYEPSPFNEIYGGVDGVSLTRNSSDELKLLAINEIKKLYPEYEINLELYRKGDLHNIPENGLRSIGAQIFRLINSTSFYKNKKVSVASSDQDNVIIH
ncbi:LPD29 domain-containing protein [Entomomonas asaccharolytica]|uniref:Large polyvalent protein associated domain-containing protein n=1 Tax=Entomomonas asaccharolytica TaxID=2785331 RepID=A0A974RWC3_9GAMM|nr:LPD29 domain-containing protein [Entomomonas asaccharolytica]QQP85025.1 hypothetical protein JHT90_11595 [Entomomonas asaccharolytica]